MFMAAFRDRFNEKVVAEMRGVIDDTATRRSGRAWASASSMEFSRADYLCGTGQKAFIAELMPKHPIYTDFQPGSAGGDRRSASANRAGPRGAGERGFRYRNYVDIFDGGPTLECDIDRVRRSVKAGW
jgi:arginine N-succinyltransferase